MPNTPFPIIGETIRKGSAYSYTRRPIVGLFATKTPAAVTARPIINEWTYYTPPAPGNTFVYGPNIGEHYYQVFILDKNGNTLDVPQGDLLSWEITDVLNGGSGSGMLTFRRNPDAPGAIAFQNRVLIWFWPWYMPRPTNPYWAGYMVDVSAKRQRTDGEFAVTIEGDSRLLAAAEISDIKINPGTYINPSLSNPSLDAAPFVAALFAKYAPPTWGTISIPSTLFPLLPMQFSKQKLDAVIDTILKSGRDTSGALVTWRVNVSATLQRTLLVQPDQNPNVFPSVRFQTIFRDGMCTTYEISTKYRDIANVILIEGGKDPTTGQTLATVYSAAASVTAYGPLQDAISVPALQDATALYNYANAYCDIHANPQAQGTIELVDPNPLIQAGTWVQIFESAAVSKQMRATKITVKGTRTRIVQTIEPTAPTPYLDEAVYRMAQQTTRAATGLVASLPVNTQQTFVRSGFF